MSKAEFSVQRARSIQRALVSLIDRSEICPRRYSHLESISLALFARMAELHETICLLASKKRLRDAVILGRTLCEANITLYWLTNDPNSDERINRYVTFGGQVTLENMARILKSILVMNMCQKIDGKLPFSKRPGFCSATTVTSGTRYR